MFSASAFWFGYLFFVLSGCIVYRCVCLHAFHINIVFLSIFCFVCLLGFLHVQRFVNLCCVFTFIVSWICLLCFRHASHGLNKCILFHICVLCSRICELCFKRHMYYVLHYGSS